MQENEIDVVRLKPLQGPFQGFFRLAFSKVFQPDLGRNKKFFPRNAGLANGRSQFFFIHIALGRVKMTVADFNGVQNGTHRIFLGNLKNTKADLRYGYSIIQGYIFHMQSTLSLKYNCIISSSPARSGEEEIFV